jgi:hypothetical protein
MVDSEYALKWLATKRSTSDDLPTPASPSSTNLTSRTLPPMPPGAAAISLPLSGLKRRVFNKLVGLLRLRTPPT